MTGFLDLPGELRNVIYEHYFTTTTNTYDVGRHRNGSGHWVPGHRVALGEEPGLDFLLSCKLVSHEAYQFFVENRKLLCRCPQDLKRLLYCLWKTKRLGVVRNLILDYGEKEKAHYWWDYRLKVAFRHCGDLPQLRELEIRVEETFRTIPLYLKHGSAKQFPSLEKMTFTCPRLVKEIQAKVLKVEKSRWYGLAEEMERVGICVDFMGPLEKVPQTRRRGCCGGHESVRSKRAWYDVMEGVGKLRRMQRDVSELMEMVKKKRLRED